MVASGSVFRLTAVDPEGMTLKSDIDFDLVPDKAPAIRVIAPAGKTILPTGVSPDIQFEVKDDFGITQVVLQRVARGDQKAEEGETIKEWPVSDKRSFEGRWQGALETVVKGSEE